MFILYINHCKLSEFDDGNMLGGRYDINHWTVDEGPLQPKYRVTIPVHTSWQGSISSSCINLLQGLNKILCMKKYIFHVAIFINVNLTIVVSKGYLMSDQAID